MSWWKQIALSVVILAAAFVAWASFFPGAPQILSRWGIEWAYGATHRAADGAAGSGGGQATIRADSGDRQPAVVTAEVTTETINDRLSALGTGRAEGSVVVKPYSAGRLTEISVVSGTEVEVGTVIARLDSDTEEIAVDRARIALDDARATLDRVNALRTSNTATKVQLTEAQLAVENARLELRDRELALERRAIKAPIAGIVGILPINAGNYVTTDSEVASIEDRTSIIIDFWVPERYVTFVKVGAPLTASLIANPGAVFEGTVSAVDNRLDEASRTLRVRADIPNPDDRLRAGMSFQVSMRFPGDTYPAVNPLAVQWGSDGAFLWTIVDGKAKRMPVRVVQRNTDTVLVDAPLRQGDIVVTEGVQSVTEGSQVRIAGREEQPPEASGS
ncbi:MAG: efflux RND transporter periplasmic adaptor subunit [Mesorhizobium sp.]